MIASINFTEGFQGTIFVDHQHVHCSALYLVTGPLSLKKHDNSGCLRFEPKRVHWIKRTRKMLKLLL